MRKEELVNEPGDHEQIDPVGWQSKCSCGWCSDVMKKIEDSEEFNTTLQVVGHSGTRATIARKIASGENEGKVAAYLQFQYGHLATIVAEEEISQHKPELIQTT